MSWKRRLARWQQVEGEEPRDSWLAPLACLAMAQKSWNEWAELPPPSLTRGGEISSWLARPVSSIRLVSSLPSINRSLDTCRPKQGRVCTLPCRAGSFDPPYCL